MKKNEEIKKILKFYELSTRLKTNIVDPINNYSSADNVFGSMMLAIAINSEYKESQSLTKTLRMLFFNEFSKINPNYQYNNLKISKQFESKINILNTEESKLVFKYKSLDTLLTKLITKTTNTNYLELLTEANKTFIQFGYKDEVKNEEIFKFYYLNFKLKTTIRSGWDNNHWNIKCNRIERISEHVIGTIALAIIMQSEFEYDINIDKSLKMLAIHEIGETLIGDITPFNSVILKEKKEIEHHAMVDALGSLTDKAKLLDILFEFDEQNSKEARFAYYCDKIDADLQAKIYQDKGLQHSLDEQQNNCVFNNQKVQKMIQDGAKTAFDIWYNWDKIIYKKDKKFPEFFLILRYVRDNNLLEL